jgi:glycosyltransferase involved in cell wall biosynthesis
MILHFHEPPPAQRVGGLDAAIRSLQSALEKAGHTILVNPTKTDGANVAHFHGMWQPGFPSIARRYRENGVPYVVSPHGMLEPWAWRHKRWKKLPYWHLIERRWVSRAALVLATAAAEKNRLREHLPKTRIESVPLGLTGIARSDYPTARAKLGWTEDETVLLFLSRIHEKKGLDLLLAALNQMTVPGKTRLVIVGPEEQPAYAARCRKLADAIGAKLRVEWCGAVWGEERWAYLQGADLLCLPTHSENFGLVVLEACQVGTPALTTTDTPWAEQLRERGLICRPTVEDVKRVLERFFGGARQSAAVRVELSNWAWENFHWDKLAPQYAALYEDVSSEAAV